jgi:hypothetical protein
MKHSSTLIHNISSDEIESFFKEIRKELNEIKENFQPKTPEEFLTRNEVRDMLKVNYSTIHKWCLKGKLIPFGIGSRVYFKRSDIEAVMIPIGINRGNNNGRK